MIGAARILVFFYGVLYIVFAENEVPQTYRIATVQFDPYFEKGVNPKEISEKNAKKYAEFAAQAKQQGAILVAFPEYGIVSLDIDPNYINYTREGILPLLPIVPDPEKVTWNPCQQPEKYNNSHVLEILSCAARENSIAILANMVTNQPCHPETQENCPSDHKLLYNTNVVFDKRGTFIAAYHKKHLFGEAILNSPPKAEYVIFEIDSIKFATFICFDIIYEDPAVDLVLKKGIKNIIFSTAWIDEMPFLLAPQLYSRWARGLGANFVASNYYKPQYTRLGTGIYSSQLGAVNETYDIAQKGLLLVADLPVDPSPVPVDPASCSESFTSDESSSVVPGNNSYVPFIMTDVPSSEPTSKIHKIYYQSLSNFSAIYLDQPTGEINLCDKGVCCHLSYEVDFNDDEAVYALTALDGIHPFGIYRLGAQICALIRCETKNDIESCGRVPEKNSSAVFTNLKLIAQLESEVALPSILNTDLQILPGKDWQYSQKKCKDKSESKITVNRMDSLLVLSIYARLYDRDFYVSN